jgi:hypothetical protein
MSYQTIFVMKELRKDDSTGVIEEVDHFHGKHLIGLQLKGPRPEGLTVARIQLYFCPACHLCWFEELPDIIV